jgi:hypothetical protein
MTLEPPAHEHDCRMCTYVGPDSPQPGEPRVNQVDMWICGNSLIRRYSSDPPDYGASGQTYPQARSESLRHE